MEKRSAEEDGFVTIEKEDPFQQQPELERLYKMHWLSDYTEDIFETMKEQELRRRPLYFLSTQLDQRPKIVYILQTATRAHKLSRCALHLALYYMDRLLDYYRIRPDKLDLTALTCLHIAAQIESADACIPRYSEMNEMVKNAYTAFEYKAVERKILGFMDFELVRPTTASFVELFACRFLTRDDFAAYDEMMANYERDLSIESPYPRYQSFEQMLSSLAQLLLRLSDYTLSITTFGNELPSLLAAACIATVRQVIGLERWTPYLKKLTTYSEAQVQPYSDILSLHHYYDANRVAHVGTPKLPEELPAGQNNKNWPSPDSGFEESMVPHSEVPAGEAKNPKIITVELQDTAKKMDSSDASQKPQKRRHNLIVEVVGQARPNKKPKLEAKPKQILDL
ncbi:cyclin-J [Drosophila bipectinata]|uniref:cyclin-J n=1 Tax=Drosophila bipectinata TaxID=42026 RepID=UPI001C8AE8AD|nr:cyclin-J [Drosophila bipectinata]